MLPTLGELYRQAFDVADADMVTEWRDFTAGFVSGQMEKVYSGACEACMFAPEEQDFAWCYELVSAISSQVYGLAVHVLQCSNRKEIWVSDPAIGNAFLRDLETMVKAGDENIPWWHHLRGRLCGISPWRIDPDYHKRYGQKAGVTQEEAPYAGKA